MGFKKIFHTLLAAIFLMQFVACTVVMDDEPGAEFDIPELTTSNTIQFTVDYGDRYPVEIHWAGNRVAVDWGDGKIEKRESSAKEVWGLKHSYTKIGTYRVKIWSEEITYLSMAGLINTYTGLSIGKCPYLHELNIGNIDGLEAFSGGYCPKLARLFLSSIHSLKSVDVSTCLALEEFSLYSMDNLASLNIKHCSKLQSLVIRDSKLSELNMESNGSLNSLQIGRSLLSEIDFRSAPGIVNLEIYQCAKLQTLDVSRLNELIYLNCTDCSLSSLDITANTKLQTLECTNNSLESLNISERNNLRTVHIYDNKLEAKVLNNIFMMLRPVTDFGLGTVCEIYVWGNPGVGDCDSNIVFNKGWRVKKELSR